MKLNSVLISFGLLFSLSSATAQQKWIDLRDKGASYHEICAAFYAERDSVKTPIKGGYKQFKRWEDYWSTRLNADGTLRNSGDLLEMYTHANASKGYRAVGDANWKCIGPYYWQNIGTYSPGLGRINVVAVDPANANIIYLGSPVGGLWKSSDGGNTWAVINEGLSSLGVGGIAIDPKNSNIIYISTGDPDHSDAKFDGIYKTVNGGQSWTKCAYIYSDQGGKVAVDPNNSSIVFAATFSGLYRSADGGQTWTTAISGMVRDFEFKPGNSNVMYACSGSKFYKSTNNGASFSEIPNVFSNLAGNRALIAVTPADPNYVYILSNNIYNGHNAVYRSVNSGTSFTERNSTTDLADGYVQTWYNYAFACSPTDKNKLFSGALNIWTSNDGGNAWSALTRFSAPKDANYVHADIHWLEFFGNKLMACTDGGFFISSDNGLTFSDKSSGLVISQIYSLDGLEGNKDILSAALQDNGGFRYNGTHWQIYHGEDGVETALDENNHQHQWGITQNGSGTYFSSDGGNNTISPAFKPNENSNWITPIVKDPNSNRVIVGFQNLYSVTPTGNNYVKLTNIPLSPSYSVTAIEVFKGNSNIIYFATNNYSSSKLYKTTNGGSSLTTLSTPWNGGSNVKVTGIETDPANSNVVWVSIGGAQGKCVYKSIDGGTSWTNISTGIPNAANGNCIKYDASSVKHGLYIGTDIGVYYMNDDMNQWTIFNDNFPNCGVTDIVINESRNLIRASTFGRGVWESNTYGDSELNYDIKIYSASLQNTINCSNTSIPPAVEIRNSGEQTVTSFVLKYKVDNGNEYTINWTGNLPKNAIANVPLNGFSTTLGNHVLKVSSSLPNQQADEYPADDTLSFYFTQESGVPLSIELSFDCKPYEVWWDLKNAQNQVVKSRSYGYYTTYSNATLSEKYCVQSGCYTFNLYDGSGDGFTIEDCTNPFPGYHIYDEGNNVLAVLTNIAFGSQHSNSFCVNNTTQKEELNQHRTQIYPNPASGVFYLQSSDLIKGIKIYNSLGEIVSQSTADYSATITLNTSGMQSGIYFVQATLHDGIKETHRLIVK